MSGIVGRTEKKLLHERPWKGIGTLLARWIVKGFIGAGLILVLQHRAQSSESYEYYFFHDAKIVKNTCQINIFVFKIFLVPLRILLISHTMSKRKETKKGEHLEIERKFLLRRVPPVKIMDKILHIDQCYTNSGRFRAVRTGTKFDYIMQKKRQLRPGVYAESAEKKISWNKYASAWKNKKKMLSKIRYMKKDKNGLVWEIDEFV